MELGCPKGQPKGEGRNVLGVQAIYSSHPTKFSLVCEGTIEKVAPMQLWEEGDDPLPD